MRYRIVAGALCYILLVFMAGCDGSDEIWPDLKNALREAGIYDYSIFLDEETSILFAVQKLKDNHNVEQLPEMDIMQRWWEYMADLMEVEEDYSPVEVELQEMFHMD